MPFHIITLKKTKMSRCQDVKMKRNLIFVVNTREIQIDFFYQIKCYNNKFSEKDLKLCVFIPANL